MNANAQSNSHLSDAPTWQERKQDYVAMMTAVQCADLAGARHAYARLVQGRSISSVGTLAAMGFALQGGNPTMVEQAARVLHQVRTGHSLRLRTAATPAEPRRSRRRAG